MEEKRIYVVVAERWKKTLRNKDGSEFYSIYIPHPPGRLAAQCAHVVSKMRIHRIIGSLSSPVAFEPITTIVLSARNEEEVAFLANVLGGRCETFYDTNNEYGGREVLTALCTYPEEKRFFDKMLGHLPLWDAK
jgi:hypothetical protein